MLRKWVQEINLLFMCYLCHFTVTENRNWTIYLSLFNHGNMFFF